MGLPGTVSRKLFIAFLESLGLVHVRTKGGHLVYDNPNQPLKRPVILQSRGKDIPRFHIQSNLNSIGVSTKEFLNYLNGK